MESATTPGTPRERLAQWLHRLEHLLPAQAPIRNFVHHNTLHGFQHLPFPEALAEARRVTGARPWLSEARCRGLLAAGRITHADLAAACDDEGIDDGELLPGVTRRAVILLGLAHDLSPLSAARRDWLLREGGALARPAAPAAAGIDLAALWEACGEVLGLASKREQASALDALFGMSDVEEARNEDWMIGARALWSMLVGRLGREWTLAALLERLTGENVLDEVRPTLVRHLSAHLDLGMAAWHNPLRHQGFYAAWRASAGVDLGWELDEWLAARDEIARLPDDPLETIARELMHLGPDESHWGDYLERLALELPGWSGMFLWREQHAVGGDAAVPVAMADYLAVRLVLERVCCEELAHRTWGLPLFLSELGDHFLCHPAELKVRHDFFAGLLGEAEAHEARRLIAAEPSGSEAWRRLAARVGTPARTRDPQRWPLFLLAQHLGLDAGKLRAAGAAQAGALLDALDTLSPDARGFLWLRAYERNHRQRLLAVLAANHGRGAPPAAPVAQLVFCMDDREEGTRRHLEEVNPAIETFGAAGFFGVPMYWVGVDDAAPTALCPVVVTPANEVREVPAAGAEAALAARRVRRGFRLEWQDRLHRVTRDGTLGAPILTALAAPFAAAALAMQSLAPASLGDLLRQRREAFDGALPTRAAIDGDGASLAGVRAGFSETEQAERVAGFLRTIGLTSRFAPLVVIVGHGSDSTNNPHAAAYDCGACSGRHGGPNARVFAAMANRPAVRAALAARGIAIPEGTWFLGCEHNTGDESIAWYDLDALPPARRDEFAALCRDLDVATQRHAVERCRRFASAPRRPTPARALRHLRERRHDWSQARPELGHATVASAFIGRRAMSRGAFFDRRAFLISYDPEGDADGRILEAILLAAGPVGAGIALEYYFSSVDNARFGCGSKVTHNLAGLFGVMEGASSDLRTGLPVQMIEIHEPMRLFVVIEQTRETVTAIYRRQPPLQELIGNGWILVAVKEPADGAIFLFDPAQGWQPWAPVPDAVPRAPDSASWLGEHREPLPPALLDPEATC